VPVFVGGVVPAEDAAKLKNMGVAHVFGPGTPMAEIVRVVRDAAGEVAHG
jgi:methylmalonyl-CoA mutase C-terminal domain/subunit